MRFLTVLVMVLIFITSLTFPNRAYASEKKDFSAWALKQSRDLDRRWQKVVKVKSPASSRISRIANHPLGPAGTAAPITRWKKGIRQGLNPTFTQRGNPALLPKTTNPRGRPSRGLSVQDSPSRVRLNFLGKGSLSQNANKFHRKGSFVRSYSRRSPHMGTRFSNAKLRSRTSSLSRSATRLRRRATR
ncbi:MAG: hypothetical protein JXB45_00285 [Candidatus Krumholzibacteriota bacterium]|nr:hypothetical protein [Candidatus Krumholzibacteriota bacterium]